MKRLKKLYKVIAMLVMVSILSPFVLSGNVVTAQAAVIKLSKEALTLDAGKSAVLKVSGTNHKITWSSSNDDVAIACVSGKIIAQKSGKATITATVDKKKLTCKLTVKGPTNPYFYKAPFEAQEYKFGKINTIYPKSWTNSVAAEQGNSVYVSFYPKSADTKEGTSSVSLLIQEMTTEAPEYSVLKEYLEQQATEDIITQQFTQLGMDAKLSGFKISDYQSKLGTAFKLRFKAAYKSEVKDGELVQTIYDVYAGKYLIQLTVTDIGDDMSPYIHTVAGYLLNSIQISK